MKRNSSQPSRASALVPAAVALALAAPALHAQTVAANTETESSLSEVVVTGTRQGGIEAADSPSPIQILSPAALEAAAGNPDLMSTLAQIVPSLTMQAFGFDMSNQTLQARLKGLSPNHVLVLINGKRRHGTANVAVDSGSVFTGGAGPDLNFIPQASIDHIEVLTEGAAAQYGSDAIAGVINIILKKNTEGTTVTGTYGADYDGSATGNQIPFRMNGATNAVQFNSGFEPTDGAYFNVTGEIHNHAHTFRGGADPRFDNPANLALYSGATNLATYGTPATIPYPYSNVPGVPTYPYQNFIDGDPESHSKIASYNAGFDFGGGLELYSFGTYGQKNAASFQNYRGPQILKYTDPATGVTTYPKLEGFDPTEQIDEDDYAATIGLKGVVYQWNWDLSTTWGRDHVDEYTIDSGNPGLYDNTGIVTPKNYYDGQMIATQWTNTIDVNRDFDVGLAGPLNVALGGEVRSDRYYIGAGEPDSYLAGGPSSFAGFAPSNQGANARSNYAGYLDLATQPITGLRIDLAGRYEHFSDFGSATVGKATARYDFTPEFAIRGTASNGFRAPTLAEEFYSSTNVGPVETQVQLAPNGPAAALLGLGKLQPEKSSNLSVGFVARPVPGMSATLDLYHIRVTNRIVDISGLYGSLNGVSESPLINQAILTSGAAINPADITTSIGLFTNGINTTTNGADLTFQFPVDYPVGHVDYSIGATYNDTYVTYTRPASPALTAALVGFPLYNLTTTSDLSTAAPHFVINLSANYTLDKFAVNAVEKIYGPSSEWDNDGGDNATNNLIYFKTEIGTTPITNLDLSYKMNKYLKVSIGALNLFNRFPPELNHGLLANWNSKYAVNNGDASGVQIYPIFSPFGIDGGFYYAKAAVSF
jgi:iron complex outermembrane receptor protein